MIDFAINIFNGRDISMAAPFKKDPIEFNQRALFPTNIFDLLPDGHECYIYEAIFKQLDTTTVENNYSVLGQNAYHPRLIVSHTDIRIQPGDFQFSSDTEEMS